MTTYRMSVIIYADAQQNRTLDFTGLTEEGVRETRKLVVGYLNTVDLMRSVRVDVAPENT